MILSGSRCTSRSTAASHDLVRASGPRTTVVTTAGGISPTVSSAIATREAVGTGTAADGLLTSVERRFVDHDPGGVLDWPRVDRGGQPADAPQRRLDRTGSLQTNRRPRFPIKSSKRARTWHSLQNKPTGSPGPTTSWSAMSRSRSLRTADSNSLTYPLVRESTTKDTG
jgi:hypothetical protein